MPSAFLPRLRALLCGLTISLIGVIFLLCLVGVLPLFDWLVHLQGDLFGAYGAKLTALLAVALLVLLIMWLLPQMDVNDRHYAPARWCAIVPLALLFLCHFLLAAWSLWTESAQPMAPVSLHKAILSASLMPKDIRIQANPDEVIDTQHVFDMVDPRTRRVRVRFAPVHLNQTPDGRTLVLFRTEFPTAGQLRTSLSAMTGIIRRQHTPLDVKRSLGAECPAECVIVHTQYSMHHLNSVSVFTYGMVTVLGVIFFLARRHRLRGDGSATTYSLCGWHG